MNIIGEYMINYNCLLVFLTGQQERKLKITSMKKLDNTTISTFVLSKLFVFIWECRFQTRFSYHVIFVLCKCNIPGASCGAGTAHLSRAYDFIPGFQWSSIFSFLSSALFVLQSRFYVLPVRLLMTIQYLQPVLFSIRQKFTQSVYLCVRHIYIKTSGWSSR